MSRFSTNELLLSVQQRVPGTQTYGPPHELVWDVSQGATLSRLRQAVSDWSTLPEARVAMAKHFPDKYMGVSTKLVTVLGHRRIVFKPII